MREVHQPLDTVDLSDNPHLRRLTDEQVLPYSSPLRSRRGCNDRFLTLEWYLLFLAQHVSSLVWYWPGVKAWPCLALRRSRYP